MPTLLFLLTSGLSDLPSGGVVLATTEVISFDASGTASKRSITDVARLHHTVGLMVPKSGTPTQLVLKLAGGEGPTGFPIQSVRASPESLTLRIDHACR